MARAGGNGYATDTLQRADDAILRQGQQEITAFNPPLFPADAKELKTDLKADAAAAMQLT